MQIEIQSNSNFQECGVCKEKFEEYWDEDDDSWKLRDCMLGEDGRVNFFVT